MNVSGPILLSGQSILLQDCAIFFNPKLLSRFLNVLQLSVVTFCVITHRRNVKILNLNIRDSLEHRVNADTYNSNNNDNPFVCNKQKTRQTYVDVEGENVNKYGLKQVFFQSIFDFWTLLELELLELYGSDKLETINTFSHLSD